MKKEILIGASAIALLAFANMVDAASYKAQAERNTIVYTSRGKKTRGKIKKSRYATVYGVKYIKGKKYLRIGRGKYVKAVNFVTSRRQTKKIVRTIKMYQPKGTKTVKQNAYVKRIVKSNLGNGKKRYGKWSTSAWKAYKVGAISGYTANVLVVQSQKVYSWTKNTTVKVTYKKNAVKKATNTPAKKASTPAKQTSSSTQSGTKNSTKSNAKS